MSRAHAQRSQVLLGAIFIAAATIVVYWPAIRGGFIWDDPEYVVNNHTLRTWGGLVEIWTAPRSLPQWYPMVHTTFWTEYRFWGLQPLGYHLVNVILHVGGALLLWRLLVRLEVPGAWLAAAVFAVHPVHVESVAWITERKNVLSGVFYLLAMLLYLRAAALRDRRLDLGAYVGALGLFILALLSKSVTATLPAAILVILWWKRGTIARRDVLRLVPFFVAGIAMGLITAYLEATHVGASGERIAELDLSAADRVLVAGRVVWFYARKLVAPWPLVFIYPRGEIDPNTWWQWLFPAGVVAVLLALILARKRLGRGPAAAAMLFCGTLFPALGFVNVYPMRFSFVADHFQYLASAALIALLASLAWRWLRQWSVVLLAPLLVLTAIRTPVYDSAETLWRDTLDRNPNSWMVHTNLAHVLRERADSTSDEALFADAERHYQAALQLAPNIHETHANVGMMLARRGESEPAIHHLNEAIRLNPDFAPAYFGIGQLFHRQGDLDRAIENYRRAIARAPAYAEANYRLGMALEQQGKLAEAADAYRVAVGAKPEEFDYRFTLGRCLAGLGQLDEAIFNLKEATRINPNVALAWRLLGVVQLKAGRQEDAVNSAQRALALDPSLSPR